MNMKKKRIIIGCAVIVFIVCASLVISNSLNLDIVAAGKKDLLSQKSAKDDSWDNIAEGVVAVENDNYLLQLDSATTHFTVTHKPSGKVYHSAAQATGQFEPDTEQTSEVVITYYDSNSAEAKMNSYENSVSGQTYEIKSDGSTIRVYYSIQKSKKVIFVPTVIGQETFEEEILSQLESGPKRRIKGFYTLYESDNDDSDTKEMKNTYAALNEENLYVLNGTAGEHNYSEITGYFDTAGYGPSEYVKEAERLGLEGGIGDNMPAGFTIPVEYALTDTGFTATVLTDRIESDSDNYKLTNVSLLPYFSSCGYSGNGWQLVPDGSGAIIELSEKVGSTYMQNIWSNDPAVESSVKPNLMQNAGMPVFGFHTGERAFFAVISGGAAVASVKAETFGNEFVQSHIYTDFNILSYDSSDMGALSNKAVFNLYSSDYVAEFPQVTYMLFSEPETTYSDMAGAYQKYLLQEGILQEKLEQTENVPVYLDFTGYETTQQSVFGITVDAKTPLSTLKQVKAAISELESREVGEINVRLKAYSNNGIYSTVSNGFEIEKCVGSEKELKDLSTYLDKNHGKLYLENNISTVYNTGNSFKKMTHAVRNLRKTVVSGIDYDLVVRTNVEAVNKYYLTSPVYFDSLTENFISTFNKEMGDASKYGYSWSDYGSKLWSDFYVKNSCDRTQSADVATKAVKKANEIFGKTLTDGSNSYVLGQVDTLLNIPLNGSELSSESYSIPFYQMVIHGYVDYSGAPVNSSTDSRKTYLASIESGANLYYSFYTSKDNPLKETEAGTLIYPTLISDSYSTIEAQYKEFNELFKELRCESIVEHERVAEDVFVTTYENGTSIAVNYSKTDYNMNGKFVAANGYAVWEGGDR